MSSLFDSFILSKRGFILRLGEDSALSEEDRDRDKDRMGGPVPHVLDTYRCIDARNMLKIKDDVSNDSRLGILFYRRRRRICCSRALQ